MLFNSLPFLIFFSIFFLLYLFTDPRFRVWLIILGSTVFYAYWNPYYILMPHALTLIAYLGALWIYESPDLNRKARMISIVTLLLLPLLLIKYANFIYNDLLSPLFHLKEYALNISLPLSLSFVTFTLIAYVVDVYSGRYPVERRLPLLTGLVLFFPHLIAGPILRPHDLLPQLEKPRAIRRRLNTRILFGIVIISIGILKKVVFADQLSACIDPIYAAEGDFGAEHYLLAIYGFSAQLYCDFSGYTDMAIGLAIMLGMRLPQNFEHPYTSGSLTEFWRRWHITLSNWLRDYLYIPLGGNRSPYRRQIINLLVTMGLGGLWHGANWTFLIWGLMHGIGIATVHGFRKMTFIHRYFHLIPRWVFVLITFHFIIFAWILFRAPDLATAYRVIKGPFTLKMGDLFPFLSNNAFFLSLLVLFFLTHRFDNYQKIRRAIRHIPKTILWPLITMIWMMVILISSEASNKFIYFDF